MTLLSLVYKWLAETYPTIEWVNFQRILAIRGNTKSDNKAIWIEVLEEGSTEIYVEIYPTTKKYPGVDQVKLASTDPKFFENLAHLIGETNVV